MCLNFEESKGFKRLCFVESKCLVDEVVNRRVQLTIRAKYKGLLGHSAFHLITCWYNLNRALSNLKTFEAVLNCFLF